MSKIKCGVIGTGWMARTHVNALLQLPKIAHNHPEVELTCVTSRCEKNYKKFGQEFGFKKTLSIEQFWNEDFECLIIATPCNSHLDYLLKGLNQDRIKNIYCEKPLVTHAEEGKKLIQIAEEKRKKIQVGFQFLQIPAIIKAKEVAPTLGKLISFQGHYLKSGYLEKSYRDSKKDRLLPAPVGGVTSDLASHIFSLFISILGDQLNVKGAIQGGSYPDVHPKSDLHVQVFLQDNQSNAVGGVTASRISTGYDDELGFNMTFEKGALEFSTSKLDTLKLFKTGEGWQELKFPQFQSRSQALVEAFFLFFGHQKHQFIPDLIHGIRVQKLINETVDYL